MRYQSRFSYKKFTLRGETLLEFFPAYLAYHQGPDKDVCEDTIRMRTDKQRQLNPVVAETPAIKTLPPQLKLKRVF